MLNPYELESVKSVLKDLRQAMRNILTATEELEAVYDYTQAGEVKTPGLMNMVDTAREIILSGQN